METKVIVAGSRNFNDYDYLSRVLFATAEDYESMSIVSGCARGADNLAIKFANEHGVQLYKFPADWSQGRGAGYARNTQMAEFADALIAFWDGESRGTQHMINEMNKRGKKVYVYLF